MKCTVTETDNDAYENSIWKTLRMRNIPELRFTGECLALLRPLALSFNACESSEGTGIYSSTKVESLFFLKLYVRKKVNEEYLEGEVLA